MKKKICTIAAFAGVALIAAGAVVYAKTGNAAWLVPLFSGAALLAIALVILLRAPQKAPTAQNRYRKKRTYISRAEWEFLQTLRSILGTDYEVCVQAPLVAVIDKENAGYRNELFRVVDYLVVDPVSYAPLLFIELNDASHNRPERAARDEKVLSICADANMPIVSFTMQEAGDVSNVRKRVLKALRGKQ